MRSKRAKCYWQIRNWAKLDFKNGKCQVRPSLGSSVAKVKLQIKTETGKASRQSQSRLPLKNGNFRLRQARVPVQNFQLKTSNFFCNLPLKKGRCAFLVLSHYRRNGKKSSESLDKFRTRKVRQSVRIFFLAFLHTYGKVCSNEKEKRQAKNKTPAKKERKE